jgi:predicted porin
MTKKLLITTGLALALACSSASAEEVKSTAPVNKVKKVKKHHRNDAYSPKHHAAAKPQVVEKKEEVIVFAEVAHPTPAAMPHNSKSDEIEIKVKGKVDVQYGGTDSRADFRHPIDTDILPQYITDKTDLYQGKKYGVEFYNEHALVTNGEIAIEAAKNLGESKYGAGLVMNANPSATSSGNKNPASKAFLFVENGMGRLEAGSLDGVSHSMSPSADRIAKATGGIDGDFNNWMTVGAYSDGISTTSPLTAGDNVILNNLFITTPGLPYANQFSKKANKVNLLSQRINGFQVGLGFTRDTTAQGTTYATLDFKGTGYKNVVEGGLSYEAKMGDNSVTLTAVGQMGSARPYYKDATTSVALKDLGAWEIGGKVKMDKITVAASYGDWDKSGTDLANTQKKKANYWTAGAAYDHKDLGVSLTYMASERQGGFAPSAYNYIVATNAANTNAAAYDKASNKYQALSFGAEYHLMPGLTPYAEVTGFEYKSTLTDVKLNKGAVFLGGIKLNF